MLLCVPNRVSTFVGFLAVNLSTFFWCVSSKGGSGVQTREEVSFYIHIDEEGRDGRTFWVVCLVCCCGNGWNAVGSYRVMRGDGTGGLVFVYVCLCISNVQEAHGENMFQKHNVRLFPSFYLVARYCCTVLRETATDRKHRVGALWTVVTQRCSRQTKTTLIYFALVLQAASGSTVVPPLERQL